MSGGGWDQYPAPRHQRNTGNTPPPSYTSPALRDAQHGHQHLDWMQAQPDAYQAYTPTTTAHPSNLSHNYGYEHQHHHHHHHHHHHYQHHNYGYPTDQPYRHNTYSQRGKGKGRWKGKGCKGQHHGVPINTGQHEPPLPKRTYENVPCIVHEVFPRAGLPSVITLVPARISLSVKFPSLLFMRLGGGLVGNAVVMSLKPGDVVSCTCVLMPNERVLPDVSTLVRLAPNPELKQELEAQFEAQSSTALKETVAEGRLQDLDLDFRIIRARLHVIMSHPFGAAQRADLRNLYTSLTTLIRRHLEKQREQGVAQRLPDNLLNLLRHDLFSLPSLWEVERKSGANSEIFQLIVQLREVLEPVLEPELIAHLHRSVRWLSYGEDDHLTSPRRQEVRDHLERLSLEQQTVVPAASTTPATYIGFPHMCSPDDRGR